MRANFSPAMNSCGDSSNEREAIVHGPCRKKLPIHHKHQQQHHHHHQHHHHQHQHHQEQQRQWKATGIKLLLLRQSNNQVTQQEIAKLSDGYKLYKIAIAITTIAIWTTPAILESCCSVDAHPTGPDDLFMANRPLQVPQTSASLTEQQQHELFDNSYVIDNQRFSEIMVSRCFTSTILNEPDTIEPSFILVKSDGETRVNATCHHHDLLEAGYEPNKRTVVFVHGFTQSYPESEWLVKMRNLFLKLHKVDTYNLIFMDWGKGAQTPFFSAAAHAHGVGAFLAIFLQRMINLGTDRMKIHVVGHSLGAHVAGFAGKRIRPPIGRITALDPAGPCFGKMPSTTTSMPYRLGPDDAYLVDVFHYDDGFLGLAGQHGQFDVYVNGGSSQPGCADNVRTMMSAAVTIVFQRDRALSESHTRSTLVPTHHLNSAQCQQVAYECSSYEAFLDGECGECDDFNNQCYLMSFAFQFDDIDEMPLRTSRPGKKLYINTNDKGDFCIQHYQIKVILVAHSGSAWFANRVSLELFDENGEMYPVEVKNQASDNILTALMSHSSGPERIIRARVRVARFSLSSYQPQVRIDSININFMSQINPFLRRSLSSRLCPVASSEDIEDNSLADLGGTNQFVECQ